MISDSINMVKVKKRLLSSPPKKQIGAGAPEFLTIVKTCDFENIKKLKNEYDTTNMHIRKRGFRKKTPESRRKTFFHKFPYWDNIVSKPPIWQQYSLPVQKTP